MSDKSLFYKGFEYNTDIDDFFDRWRNYAEKDKKGNPVYILDKPLDKKVQYEYDKAVVILIPKYKILFLNYGKDEDAFADYEEDFLDDVGHISDKYEYMKVLGRMRQWRKEFVSELDYDEVKNEDIEEILERIKLPSKQDERKGEFLISLITGSINDIEKTGLDYPETLLEKIKRKIILFDGDQTRFIYNEPKEKKIRIQGLAGTGKTELLLHKIKELYVNNHEVKIVFTCYNIILAENLKTRIPEFFNFMKVTEQIKWNEKLWVMRSWGSKRDENSGVYSYICNYYNIPFEGYCVSRNFDAVCRNALNHLNEIENFEECFDYILIDESQDFSENFFGLCEKVTKRCVYIAGDIFQNVFEDIERSKVAPQFMLNKCYRTDPKTLMSAHAIGMGLFEEKHQLRWLEDQAWNDCGYDIKKKDGYYDLYRKPLRRFEDLGDVNISSLVVEQTERDCYYDKIMKIIEKIKEENETVEPDDIGIVFMENRNANYEIANQLKIGIKEKYGWNANIGYESKEKRKGTLFISNRNNVKGLEFPFVIAFMQDNLTDNLRMRNSVYMILTRSFITSYFILPMDNIESVMKIVNGVK